MPQTVIKTDEHETPTVVQRRDEVFTHQRYVAINDSSVTITLVPTLEITTSREDPANARETTIDKQDIDTIQPVDELNCPSSTVENMRNVYRTVIIRRADGDVVKLNSDSLSREEINAITSDPCELYLFERMVYGSNDECEVKRVK